MTSEWWKRSIVYQIYPRSFQDSDGDGMGDLRGIIKRLPYLQNLGVDVIWISPMFSSPMEDNGYDISDYYKVDPIFGTDADMKKLLQEAKKRDLKVILDLVLNHCSDEHVWFQKAIREPESEEAGYFYFQRTADGKQPNNWRSNFGGSVWTELPDGRWYYHTFSYKQPDLNWENPKLREQIFTMINWWLEQGVSGFRVDAITFIKKDLTFASRKTVDGLRYPVEKLENYPGIGTFLGEMRDKTFQKHHCLTVAEAPGVSKEDFCNYAGENGYFSMIFDFAWESMEEESDKSSTKAIERLKKKMFDSQRFTSQHGWSGLFLENHDQSRCLNRYLEEKDRNFQSASALATLYFFLHGTPYIYQGQEIGITNARWNSIEEMNDVRAKTIYEEGIEQGKQAKELLQYFNDCGRDNARIPMQWDDSENAGFTTGKPWLKLHEKYKKVNVKLQEENPDSLLQYYKKLIALHKQNPYEELLAEGDFTPILEEKAGLFAYERRWNQSSLTVVVNFTGNEMKIPSTNENIILNNYPKSDKGEDGYLLQPYQALVLEGKL